MIRELHNPVPEKLIRPPTLPTQIARPDFTARRMPQVRLMIQIRLEPQMIIRMHHLVRQHILQHALLLDIVRAQHNPVAVIEPAQHSRRTRPTANVRRIHVPAQSPDVVAHVPDDGAVAQEVVALLFATGAIDGRIPCVGVGPVLLLACGGHGAGGHAVEVFEAVG